MNPALVVHEKNGEICTVRYDAMKAMVLDETIARLQKQIEALTAGLQKVSAQLEASKATRQVVNNP